MDRTTRSRISAAADAAAIALAQLQNELFDLRAKLQYLVDAWPTKLEDGCITFPDGDYIEKSE